MARQNENLPVARGWDPFADFELFRPGLLQRLVGEPWGGSTPAAGSGPALPAIDVHENEGAYVVTAELAGCKPEDVTVEVHEGVLSIRGEKRSERSEENEQRRWTERSYGSFHRSLRLPADAAADRVEASFADGVLTVEVKKVEESKPTVVRIQS